LAKSYNIKSSITKLVTATINKAKDNFIKENLFDAFELKGSNSFGSEE
jgi:hypothetical protein